MRGITTSGEHDEIVLRHQWRDLPAEAAYGLIALGAAFQLAAQLTRSDPSWVIVGFACFLIVLSAVAIAAAMRSVVWLRPGEIAFRRYGRIQTLASRDVLSVADTDALRQRPVALLTGPFGRTALPVPFRTIFGLTGTRRSQVAAVRAWWEREQAAAAHPVPKAPVGRRAGHHTDRSNPYASPEQS